MRKTPGDYVSPADQKEDGTMTLDQVYEQCLLLQDGQEKTFYVDHEVTWQEMHDLMDREFDETRRRSGGRGPRNMIDWTHRGNQIVAKCIYRDPLFRG